MVNEKPDKSRVFTVPMLGKCYTGTVLSYGGELIPRVPQDLLAGSFGLSPRAKSRGLAVVFAVGLSARRDSSTRCARSE